MHFTKFNINCPLIHTTEFQFISTSHLEQQIKLRLVLSLFSWYLNSNDSAICQSILFFIILPIYVPLCNTKNIAFRSMIYLINILYYARRKLLFSRQFRSVRIKLHTSKQVHITTVFIYSSSKTFLKWQVQAKRQT